MRLLLWLRQHGSPLLDDVFLPGHYLGGGAEMALLVLVAVVWNARRRRWREAGLWLALAVSTCLLWLGLKHGIERPRPQLWERIVSPTGYAFPSGHALGTATFVPLFARELAERWRLSKPVLIGTGVLLSLYVGIGRLYLGVHWPMDVLAGWALGFGQCWLGVRLVTPKERRAP